MARCWLVSISWFFLFSQSTTTAEVASPEEKRDFEGLAAKLKFFATIDFIFDRDLTLCSFIPENERKDYKRLLTELTNPKRDVKSLVDLLKHRDPRVRTLALGALFAKEDPKLLPRIAELLNDGEESFKIPVPAVGLGRPHPEFEEQTVGEIAEEMLRCYVPPGAPSGPIAWRLAGWGRNAKERANAPEPRRSHFDSSWAAYWAKRKNRDFCLSWFAAQVKRANQGASDCIGKGRVPLREGRVEKVRAVRRRIDQLPKADRTWTLLALNKLNGADCLATDLELVNACKELGADNLMRMLQGKIPSDDPDLQGRSGYYYPMSEFVLEYAGQLLRRQDADFLLTNGWVIPAAELLPEKAEELLRHALQHVKNDGVFGGTERAKLAVALWRLLGPSQIPFLVEWLYKDKPRNDSTCQIFLNEIIKLRKPDNRKLVAKIIQDPSFDKLDWRSLEILVYAVNSWVDKPVVSEDTIGKAWHPYGYNGFEEMQSRGMKEYPRETKELLNTLNEWRKDLRASVPRWSK